MKNTLLFLVIFLVFVFSGCATTQNVQKEPVVTMEIKVVQNPIVTNETVTESVVDLEEVMSAVNLEESFVATQVQLSYNGEILVLPSWLYEQEIFFVTDYVGVALYAKNTNAFVGAILEYGDDYVVLQPFVFENIPDVVMEYYDMLGLKNFPDELYFYNVKVDSEKLTAEADALGYHLKTEWVSFNPLLD